MTRDLELTNYPTRLFTWNWYSNRYASKPFFIIKRILLTEHPAYTGASGNIQSSLYSTVGVYCWAWFIFIVIYTIGTIRSSWVLLMTLLFLDVELLLLATGYVLNCDKLLAPGSSVGFAVAFCSCRFFFSHLILSSPSLSDQWTGNSFVGRLGWLLRALVGCDPIGNHRVPHVPQLVG